MQASANFSKKVIFCDSVTRCSLKYPTETFVHSGTKSTKFAESVNTPVGSIFILRPALPNSAHNSKANSFEQQGAPNCCVITEKKFLLSNETTFLIPLMNGYLSKLFATFDEPCPPLSSP